MVAERLTVFPDRYLQSMSIQATNLWRDADSQDLINVLAIICARRNATVDIRGTRHRCFATLRQFDPRVVKTSIDDQINTPPSLGVSIIHIPRNDHRFPSRLILDVTQQLQILGVPRILIPLVITRISVQIIQIKLNAGRNLRTHERKAFGSETVSLVDETFIPCHAVESGEWELRERV
jgi:hypothetical protein